MLISIVDMMKNPDYAQSIYFIVWFIQNISICYVSQKIKTPKTSGNNWYLAMAITWH